MDAPGGHQRGGDRPDVFPEERLLLIFDLDGTLADTRADLAAGINRMRAWYGLSPLSLETVQSFIGEGVRVLVERSLQGAPVNLDEAVVLNRQFYAEEMLCRTVLYPGVAEGLRCLAAAGHALAVLSNKPGDPSRVILAHLGVQELFFRILGGGDLPVLKPAPDGIFALMAEAAIPGDRVWMIGDHHTDLEVAHNAGVRCGFVTYGIGHPGGFAPDRTWGGFEELTRFFLNERSEP